MMADRPHAAVWLDIPDSCQLRGKFTVDLDIQVMIGQPNDELNVIFERAALARFVGIANELLAVPAPEDPEVELPEVGSPAP